MEFVAGSNNKNEWLLGIGFVNDGNDEKKWK